MRDVLLACECLPAYGDSMLSLMNAVMRHGNARPEIALTGDRLGRLGHPVQMIWGDRDPFGPLPVARRAAAILPDAELHVVPGGHARRSAAPGRSACSRGGSSPATPAPGDRWPLLAAPVTSGQQPKENGYHDRPGTDIEQLRDAWDAIAPRYDEYITPQSIQRGEDALRGVDVQPGTRFLDVAAGSGALSIPAARRGARVIASASPRP